jgi:hypothetical protein
MASTIIAGMLHILMAPRSIEREFLEGIFFLISGVMQVFWLLPILKEWHKVWYYVGIGGTGVLFALWFMERIPGLVDGRGIRLSPNTIAIEGFQIAFIVLCFILVRRRAKTESLQKIEA